MVMEHLRMNGGILGKLDIVDVVEVICIVLISTNHVFKLFSVRR